MGVFVLGVPTPLCPYNRKVIGAPFVLDVVIIVGVLYVQRKLFVNVPDAIVVVKLSILDRSVYARGPARAHFEPKLIPFKTTLYPVCAFSVNSK